jgi:glutamate formiminotransferase
MDDCSLWRITSPTDELERVMLAGDRREAARYGAHIVTSEVIGLIPRAALTDAAQWY